MYIKLLKKIKTISLRDREILDNPLNFEDLAPISNASKSETYITALDVVLTHV